MLSSFDHKLDILKGDSYGRGILKCKRRSPGDIFDGRLPTPKELKEVGWAARKEKLKGMYRVVGRPALTSLPQCCYYNSPHFRCRGAASSTPWAVAFTPLPLPSHKNPADTFIGRIFADIFHPFLLPVDRHDHTRQRQ